MPNWLHRTTKKYLKSVASADLPEAQGNFIEDPDLSAVTGWEKKYWEINGDVVTLADPATRNSIDANRLAAARDVIADQIDVQESYQRAMAEAFLDEFNNHADKINEILDAIDNATSLADLKSRIGAITDYPQRTRAQLKTVLRNKLG